MFLKGLSRCFSTSSSTFRWHSEKVANPHLRRYGYVDKVKTSGPLPRVSNDSDRINGLHLFIRENPWVPSRALAGQNDYIDILGDEEIHPVDLMYGIPKWLRGFQGTYLQTMIRKRDMLRDTGFDKVRPKDWKQLNVNLTREYRKNVLSLNQRRWTNYKGIKFGPAPNHFQSPRGPF
nr:39S ribosomal protein L51, mitochondrial-like isoform X2 [Lepeophtheirus salmonis]